MDFVERFYGAVGVNFACGSCSNPEAAAEGV